MLPAAPSDAAFSQLRGHIDQHAAAAAIATVRRMQGAAADQEPREHRACHQPCEPCMLDARTLQPAAARGCIMLHANRLQAVLGIPTLGDLVGPTVLFE